MSRILVLGGTKYFGRHLVQQLLEAGEDVTIATRGQQADPFGDRVRRIKMDRESLESLQTAAAEADWDVVYDNICYSPNEAADACKAFAGRTKRYIFISTQAVYEQSEQTHPESDFNPYDYPLQMGSRHDFPYGELKRLAEAVYFQQASFPVVAVRFPIVMGTDDYTQRLVFHIDRIREEQSIGLPNVNASMSAITSYEAGAFLFWLRNQALTGPINACSLGVISIADILAEIEQRLGKQAIIESEITEANASPYGIEHSWMMDQSKAAEEGFEFSRLAEWYPALVKELTS